MAHCTYTDFKFHLPKSFNQIIIQRKRELYSASSCTILFYHMPQKQIVLWKQHPSEHLSINM